MKGKVVPFERDSEFFFRAGVRHASRRKFADSLKMLQKAVKMDPFNADYLFNLACVLAELKQTKESIQILLEIIKNIDPTLGECYFGLGCNYFEMGELKKSRDAFEKYVAHHPHGQFSDEAYDILYYLQIYDEAAASRRGSKSSTRISGEVKELLEQGLYEKASRKLEKLIELDPDAVLPRNNLALTCFFMGQTDRAISLAKSALKLDKSNVFALCNLSLFYGSAGKADLYKKYLSAITKVRIKHPDEFLTDTGFFITVAIKGSHPMDSFKAGILEVLNTRREKVGKPLKK